MKTGEIVPHNGTETSREAALKMRLSGRAGVVDGMILDAIKASENGLTCFELEAILCKPHQTVSARLTVLRRNFAAIYFTGDHRRNPESGNRCNIYRHVTDLDFAQAVDPDCQFDPFRGKLPRKITVEQVLRFLKTATNEDRRKIEEALTTHEELTHAN